MKLESGFIYNGKDPIYEMDSLEFASMLSDLGYGDIEHPTDLKDISLDMWRAKWVFVMYKENQTKFTVDKSKILMFKNTLL